MTAWASADAESDEQRELWKSADYVAVMTAVNFVFIVFRAANYGRHME